MELYKGRLVVQVQKVGNYRNLNLKDGGFSIRDSKTNLVLGHAPTVLITGGIEFKVNEKGRLKTITERRKRVHAFVRGYLVSTNEVKPTDMTRVLVYDPYTTPLFKDVSREQYLQGIDGDVFFEDSVMFTRESSTILLINTLL